MKDRLHSNRTGSLSRSEPARAAGAARPRASAGLREKHFQTLFLALPFILYLYPAAALLTSKSSVPAYFDRYSSVLLLLNVLNATFYGAFVLGSIRGRRAVQFGAILGLSTATLIQNNALLQLPAIEATAQLTRLLAGLSLILVALLAEKERRVVLARFSATFGIFVAITGLVDFSWGMISKLTPTEKAKQIYGQYRLAYDLTKVNDQDIVLVGDSFVWGQGVPLEQRFGDVLERRLQARAPRSRVYSLGLVGVGVDSYIRQLQDIPSGARAKQVIAFFYANDMPPRSTLQESLFQAAASVGRGSVTMRLVADLAQIALTPNVEAYASQLLANFNEKESTFSRRWNQLDGELAELFQVAKTRSAEQPMLALLPMLTDFQSGAFEEPLKKVSRLAERIGFRVVELGPTFRTSGETAEGYRAAPNDLHLNARGNEIIAGVLLDAISRPAGSR